MTAPGVPLTEARSCSFSKCGYGAQRSAEFRGRRFSLRGRYYENCIVDEASLASRSATSVVDPLAQASRAAASSSSPTASRRLGFLESNCLEAGQAGQEGKDLH